jgi:hypothetical protein
MLFNHRGVIQRFAKKIKPRNADSAVILRQLHALTEWGQKPAGAFFYIADRNLARNEQNDAGTHKIARNIKPENAHLPYRLARIKLGVVRIEHSDSVALCAVRKNGQAGLARHPTPNLLPA